MMALGQRNAAVALPLSLPQDFVNSLKATPLGSVLTLAGVQLGPGVTVEGPLAAALRRAAYLYRQPTNEHRVQVGTAASHARTHARASRGSNSACFQAVFLITSSLCCVQVTVRGPRICQTIITSLFSE